VAALLPDPFLLCSFAGLFLPRRGKKMTYKREEIRGLHRPYICQKGIGIVNPIQARSL
jgi:hypothetical protein